MPWKVVAPRRGRTSDRLGDPDELVEGLENDPGRSPPAVLVSGGIAAATLLRVLVFWVPALRVLDSDEAVVGLMAMHVLRGRVPAFYWGQAYGGTLEVFPVAGLFALFGPHTLLLKAVPVALSAAVAWLVWRIGRRTVREPAATVGALLFLVWPAFFIWMSTKERGFYWAALALALGAMLLTLRLAERDSRLELFALGLLLGLGWWTTPQILYVALPAGVWLVRRRPSVLRGTPLVVVGAALGAAPWLAANVGHHWPSRWQSLQPEPNWYLSHLWGFFWRGFPRAYGLSLAFSGKWLAPGLAIPIFALILGGFAWALWRRPEGCGLLLGTCLAYPFLYASMPPGWLPEPRYVLFLSPPVALLLGRVIISSSKGPPAWAAWLGAAALVSASVLWMLRGAVPIEIGTPDKPPPTEMAALIDALESRRVDRVFADYWIAYRLSFESRERIIATPFEGAMRSAAYDQLVRAGRRPAYVFVEGSVFDPFFATSVEKRGFRYERVVVNGFVVYTPHTKVLPEDVWR
jgi:hypothetical protein